MPAALKDKRDALSEAIVTRYTKAEMERIEETAEEHDVSIARVIRVAVLQMFERMDEEQATRKKRKRK